MSIGELLQASCEAHLRYRENLPRRIANGASTVVLQGDTVAAGQALFDACRLRADAHVLDPKRLDPAWADQPDTFPHDALLDFYVGQL